jgi:2-polyprenyl-3-methyl-5-hydroxy-6-metoxy-1,4-benzoquinol methylase
MPTSNLALALDAVTLVHEVKHDWILDIGPGYGRYGLLLRELLNVKPERLDAIEAEITYLEKFRWLHCIYDNVIHGDGSDLPEEFLDQYDIVLLYDVIEHIEKQKALDLIERIRGRIAIITPVDFFEQHVEGVPSEDHVSHWTLEEFQAMDRIEVAYITLGGIVTRLGPRK